MKTSILLVEADPYLCPLRAAVLTRKGYLCRYATDWSLAFQEAEKRPFQLILTDSDVLDSQQITRAVNKIREIQDQFRPRLPVIIGFTANASITHEDCLANGMDGVLFKHAAISPGDLVSAIEKILS